MFGKVKFFLVCAMLAVVASACSSDDSSTANKGSGTGYRVSNEDYVVEVIGTREVELRRIEVSTIEGEDVKLYVKDEFEGKSTWTKEFKKTVKQKVLVVVSGSSELENAKMEIRVKKGANVIKEVVAEGTSLYGEVIF